MTCRVGLLGAGGQAREAADLIRGEGGTVAFSAVSERFVAPGLLSLDDAAAAFPSVPVLACLGAPRARRTLVEEWHGLFATVTSSRAWIAPSARLGPGVFVSPLAAVSSAVSVGRHALFNLHASVSHDTTVGDFATLSPGAHVGGGCVIGDGVFVGIGAIVRDGVNLAAGSVVGAGAVILHDTEPNGVYVGVPARLVRVADDWLDEIRRPDRPGGDSR